MRIVSRAFFYKEELVLNQPTSRRFPTKKYSSYGETRVAIQ